jgi:hypothetical protein
MLNLTASMVTVLRGAPITVLMLMVVERRPLAQGYLTRHTRYTDKTVASALMLLADYGLVTQTGRYEWALAGGATQLPLGMDALAEPMESGEDEAEIIDETAEEEDGKNFVPARSELFRPNPSSSSSGLTESIDESLLPLDAREPARKNSDLQRKKPPKHPPADARTLDPAVLAALDAAGIREPVRSRLAGLAHVTPALVAYHAATCERTGQAVYRIEHAWAMRADDPGEDEDAAERRRYVEGAYADYIVR